MFRLEVGPSGMAGPARLVAFAVALGGGEWLYVSQGWGNPSGSFDGPMPEPAGIPAATSQLGAGGFAHASASPAHELDTPVPVPAGSDSPPWAIPPLPKSSLDGLPPLDRGSTPVPGPPWFPAPFPVPSPVRSSSLARVAPPGPPSVGATPATAPLPPTGPSPAPGRTSGWWPPRPAPKVTLPPYAVPMPAPTPPAGWFAWAGFGAAPPAPPPVPPAPMHFWDTWVSRAGASASAGPEPPVGQARLSPRPPLGGSALPGQGFNPVPVPPWFPAPSPVSGPGASTPAARVAPPGPPLAGAPPSALPLAPPGPPPFPGRTSGWWRSGPTSGTAPSPPVGPAPLRSPPFSRSDLEAASPAPPPAPPALVPFGNTWVSRAGSAVLGPHWSPFLVTVMALVIVKVMALGAASLRALVGAGDIIRCRPLWWVIQCIAGRSRHAEPGEDPVLPVLRGPSAVALPGSNSYFAALRKEGAKGYPYLIIQVGDPYARVFSGPEGPEGTRANATCLVRRTALPAAG